MSKQEAQDWLNNIIEMNHISKELAVSKTASGFEAMHIFTGVHMYKGIEILAKVLGEELIDERDWCVNEVEHIGRKYFYYNRIEVFELYNVK